MLPFTDDATLLLALAPFVTAAVAAPMTHAIGHRAGWVLALVPAVLFWHFLGMVERVAAGETILVGADWAPSLGLRYSMLIDGLSLTFALLISGIGTLIIIYAGGYLKGHSQHGRFFAFMFAFMGAMLGLVLADNLLSLFVLWELTSVTSFLLIGFDHTRRAARRAALQALFVTGGGGLALLTGFILITGTTGLASMSEILAAGDALRGSDVYLAIFVLVLLGAFTKSAQVPFHSWLPNAMEAPTPVSAYLHSATMVKAGVYLLMRMQPALGGTPEWEFVLPLFGGLTLLSGTILAIRQTDLKLILAYTTVASLGLLVMLTGLGVDYALAGAVLYLVAHALFKGCLFMVAGCVDHETGTRDITKLGGLAPKMPITFLAALISCISMAGLPPLIGFVAKEVLYEGVWEASGVSIVLLAAVAGNALMFAIAGALLIYPFFGRLPQMPKAPHEGYPSLWLGPIVLAAGGLAAALLLDPFTVLVADPMTSAVAGRALTFHFHLLPAEIKPPVILTLITIALGIAVLLVYRTARRVIQRDLDRIGWGPDDGFDQLIAGLVRLSARIERLIQPGTMTLYTFVVFVLVAVALLVPPIVFGEWPRGLWVGEQPPLHYWAICIIALIGLWVVVVAKTRLVAIISLGIQGTMVALIFMLWGAPDLSFTQFMVEILSVIILALVMTRLNLVPSDHRRGLDQARSAAVAVACGVGFALVLLSVVEQPFDPRLSEFFNTYAYEIAHGRNVVNVILVDFRALDTLGEIAVVMTAGIAVLALLRVRTRAPSPTATAALAELERIEREEGEVTR
jgi:multicomponent Na+:H+ antiporter subunit A